MPTFEWKGTARNGQTQTGVLVADTKDAVIAAMRRQQIVVTAVKEKGKEIAVPKFGGKVPPQLVAIFTRQFSVMIDAGLPLVQCLEILGSQQENKVLKKALIQIRQDVESGSSLADAMRKHPKVFNDLFTNMVAAGEAGGILDTILQRLAQYIEKAVKLNGQVKSAMIYPVAVISIAVIVVMVILWKVIPVFASLFKGLGAELPLPTKVVIALSNFIADFWWLIGGTIAATIFAVKRYRATERGRRVIDAIALKMPIVGMLLRKIAVARFCRTDRNDRRDDLRRQTLPRHRKRPPCDRRHRAQDADRRHAPAQDRRRAFLPHVVDAHVVGCSHPRRSHDHGEDIGQRHRRRRDHGHAQVGRRREDDQRAARRHRRVPVDGRADDRRR